MKKQTLIIIVALLATGTTTQNYAVEEKTAKAIKRGGTLVGAGAGAIAGYFGGQKIAERIDQAETRKGKLIGIAGAATGAKIGAEIGSHLGERAAVLYLSKKNNVSKRIALASLILGWALNDGNKAFFYAAERKDTEFLKGFFTTFYLNVFGEQWYDIVPILINKALGYKIAPAFILGLHIGEQALARQFYATILLSYVTAILYFDQDFPTLEILRNQIIQVKATKQLFDKLFGEMKVNTPKPEMVE